MQKAKLQYLCILYPVLFDLVIKIIHTTKMRYPYYKNHPKSYILHKFLNLLEIYNYDESTLNME